MKGFYERNFNHIKIGDKYGQMTVLKTGQILNTYRYMALCKCDCGNEKFVRVDSLKSGHTVSCGCEQLKVATKHNLWKHPLYPAYSHMISRCYNKNDKRYARYGGRGIKVCDRWLNILNFVQDMEPSFQLGLTINRIDNDGDYSLNNCEWATTKEQNRNYSKNITYTHNSETLCLKEWSEKLSIPYSLLHDRIRVRGWSFEKAISTPKLS